MSSRFEPALVVILAGVCAALHVGKLPPAIPALQASLGLSLVQAGFLLSLVQLAGMAAGLAFGALADGLGARRSIVAGLGLLAAASAAGAWATSATELMVLRACEGFGFLLVVLAAPTLVRQLVAPGRLNLVLGLWGAYMPLATAAALLLGPWVIGQWGWAAWWLGLGGVTAAMAAWLVRAVPAAASVAPAGAATAATQEAAAREASSLARAFTALRRQWPITLGSAGPWLLAIAFSMYAGQWLAVIGFLPTIYAAAGVAPALAGALTALAAAANIVGNVMAGRWLHVGVAPVLLLRVGYTAMALAALAAFAPWAGAGPGDAGGAAWLRYAAVLVFSGLGGLVPATLFTLSVPATPREGSLSSTVGWMQQWSALGQFAGPPGVAWVAAAAGGWHLTWVVTGACAATGLGLTVAIARVVVAAPAPATASKPPG